MVEHLPSKQRAAGSNPVSRSRPHRPKSNRETRKIREKGAPKPSPGLTNERRWCGTSTAPTAPPFGKLRTPLSDLNLCSAGGGVVGEVRGDLFGGEAVAGVVDDGVVGEGGDTLEVEGFVGGVVVH